MGRTPRGVDAYLKKPRGVYSLPLTAASLLARR